MKSKFRVLYIEDLGSDDGLVKTVIEILPHNNYTNYMIFGNCNLLKLKNIKKDWGKTSKLGRYIKLP